MRARLLGVASVLGLLVSFEPSGHAHPAPSAPPPAPRVRAVPRKPDAAAVPRKIVLAPAKPRAEAASPELLRARLAAARGSGAMQAVQDFPRDRGVAIAAVTTNEEALRFVDVRLRRAQGFLKAAVLANPYLVMPEMQDPYARDLLEAVLPAATRETLLAEPEVAAAVAAHRALLAKVPDVDPAILPNRRLLAELVANRTEPRAGDKRPIAVVAYPVEDWNGQFFGRTSELEGLTKRYRVMFYQVATDDAFVAAIDDATKEKRAELVVIGGHGESALTAFGADDPAKLPAKARAQLDSARTSPRVRQRILDRIAKLNEERYLDLSDRAQLVKVADRIAPGAAIALISCSTGKGGAEAKNLANFLHDIFPQARIDAPTEAVPNLGVQLDARGYYEDAGFAAIGKRYRIEPRP